MSSVTGRSGASQAPPAPAPVRPRGDAGALAAALAASAIVATTAVGVALQPSVRPEHILLPFDLTPWEAVTAVALVVAAWLAAARTRGAALGMLALTAGTALPLWASWSTLPPLSRAAAAAIAPLALAGAAQVALRWNEVADPRATLPSVYGLSLAAGAVQLALLDPLAELECRRTCMAVALPWGNVLGAQAALGLVSLLLAVAGVVGVIAIVRGGRALAPPILATGSIAGIALIVSSGVLRAAAWAHGALADIALVLWPAAAAAVSAAVLAASMRALSTRRSVARVLAELTTPSADGDRILSGSRSVRAVEFAVPGTATWVDGGGAARPVTSDDAPRLLLAADSHEPFARITIARRAEVADVAAALTPAVRLSLRNAQLAAATKARLTETRASRRRIVESSDAEARRIERDLHDGAQQRLVSASLYLSVAKSSLSTVPAELDAAESSIRSALAQLRRLAHGLVPADLTLARLPAALDDAARASGASVTLEIDVSRASADDSAALAAFSVANAGIAAAARTTTEARIAVLAENGDLRVTVGVTGDRPPASDLVDVADRVGALGGELVVHSAADGAIIEAVIPCASSSPTM